MECTKIEVQIIPLKEFLTSFTFASLVIFYLGWIMFGPMASNTTSSSELSSLSLALSGSLFSNIWARFLAIGLWGWMIIGMELWSGYSLHTLCGTNSSSDWNEASSESLFRSPSSSSDSGSIEQLSPLESLIALNTYSLILVPYPDWSIYFYKSPWPYTIFLGLVQSRLRRDIALYRWSFKFLASSVTSRRIACIVLSPTLNWCACTFSLLFWMGMRVNEVFLLLFIILIQNRICLN